MAEQSLTIKASSPPPTHISLAKTSPMAIPYLISCQQAGAFLTCAEDRENIYEHSE